MESYNFNEYVGSKDQLNEGVGNWLKKMTNWSPAPEDVDQARKGGWPMKDVGQQPQPNAAARALGNMAQPARRIATLNLTPAQQAQGRVAHQQATQPQQRVKFSRQYLANVANTAEQYLNLIQGFAKRIRNQTKDPTSQSQIAKSFANTVLPHYQKLSDWIGWAKDMINKLPQREWVEEDVPLIEAVKVGYGKFQDMQRTMQDVVSSMRQWINNLGSDVPQFKPYVGRIQSAFDNNVVQNDISYNLASQFQSMGEKVKELMAIHGRPHNDIGERQPGGPSASGPHGTYGSKLAGSMARQGQAAQDVKNAGYGVSALQKGQQGSVPFVPVGKAKGSMLNRG